MKTDLERVLECVQNLVRSYREEQQEILPDSLLADFIDSFYLIKLVVALEAEFQIRFQRIHLQKAESWESAQKIAELIGTILRGESK